VKNLIQEIPTLPDSNLRLRAPVEIQNHAAQLLVNCREMPAFDADNLENVRFAFEPAASCGMRQAWLKEPEIGFEPGVVRTGWRKDSLLIFAELTDVDIFSEANSIDYLLWEAGEVFEMFLRPLNQPAYVEFHVTPRNQRLQLRFADSSMVQRVRKSKSVESVLIRGEAFQSLTWVRPQIQQWFVYAEIPASSVCSLEYPLAGSQWQFSFSRYDYTRGRKEPVISSTSPHAAPDFHRQHEWGVLHFQP
jgi:hypothetical protein